MEELTVMCCLWSVGIWTRADYFARLDEMFLADPENDILLELEGLGDCASALAMLAANTIDKGNADKFGMFLFSKLEQYYEKNVKSGKLPLEKFGRLCSKLWIVLPVSSKVAYSEPFQSLIYADDPLSWGDREQTVELYQKAFYYYKTML